MQCHRDQPLAYGPDSGALLVLSYQTENTLTESDETVIISPSNSPSVFVDYEIIHGVTLILKLTSYQCV